MGRMELKRVDTPSGPVLDALELLQVYGVPLGRVFDHPAFRLAMCSVIVSEGGDPNEYEGLRLPVRTRLSLIEIELEWLKLREERYLVQGVLREAEEAVRRARTVAEAEHGADGESTGDGRLSEG